MANGDDGHNALDDLLKATGSSEDTIGMAKGSNISDNGACVYERMFIDERKFSGGSLCILRPRPVGIVHSDEKVYTFVYINSAAVMSSPPLLLSAASTKALCSTILTVSEYHVINYNHLICFYSAGHQAFKGTIATATRCLLRCIHFIVSGSVKSPNCSQCASFYCDQVLHIK